MLFQNSDLWRRLRYSLDRRRRSYSDESLVAVSSKGQGIGQLRGSEDGDSAVPIEGRALLREVLRQLVTSVAFLHERGTVHRGEFVDWPPFPASAPPVDAHRQSLGG